MAHRCNSIFDAALPEPFRVLGLKLKPFSLGHYILLKRHGVSFVADEQAGATREDLIFGVLVCSQTFDEFNDWIEAESRWRDKACAIWLFCTGRIGAKEAGFAFQSLAQWQCFNLGRKWAKIPSAEKAKLFQQYIEEHSRSPKYWILNEAKHETGGHWAANVLCTLTGPLGFSRQEALNMPLSQALLCFFTHAETLGTVELMTDDQITEAEKAKETNGS